jgi:mono/diheme cytochrome c family protein
MRDATGPTLVLGWMLLGASCQGDWLGPVERGARAAFNGWDMWNTPAVRPYEDPMPEPVAGTVPMTPVLDLERARAKIDARPVAARRERAALSYRRYCHHCHGPNGDARIIVGESFDVVLPDLRHRPVQDMSDQELIRFLVHGSANMIPLGPTMSAVELLEAIEHVRTLVGAPSRPYFPPRYVEPIAPPG